MVNLIIQIFILIANLVAILLVYYSFNKGMEKQKRILNTMISVGIVYIIVLIVYSISSIGLAKNASFETAIQLFTMTFVPINVILFEPFIIHSYTVLKEKRITEKAFKTRTTVVLTIAIIVLITEFFYFRASQQKIIETQNRIQSIANSTINNTQNIQTTNTLNQGELNVISNNVKNTIATNNLAK